MLARGRKKIDPFLPNTFQLILENHLHIVCFDIPYPVDHGGYFDLFYKLVALKKAGVSIHLHCFEYGRAHQPILNEYCESVRYYKRQSGHKGFSHKIPYIVSSRINELLYHNLLQDNHPILLEGIHCSFLLHDERFKNRKILLRLHNVEHLYYERLATSSAHIMKKLYYWNESRLLRKYEKGIANKAIILTVSETDATYYREHFGATKISYIPVFTPFEKVSSHSGVGLFCLYHGNLSVPENEKVAFWLLKKVFNDINLPFVIAGKDPSQKLMHFAEKQSNTCVVANPGWNEMQDMIVKAQINIIPSFNVTGVKLKLLNILYNGRHCIVNQAAIKGTGLESTCYSAESPEDLKSLLLQLYHQPFGEEEIKLRQHLLENKFSHESIVKSLIPWIW